ncbi:hnh endonuclease : HNH endonuclease OS=Pseudanabaena biceps PCC 7429 GN=Pse7429DRAFT_1180 PE=4 SV=1: HNH [Gemmataceae bacterium]|nr:hnh endonuclease : HNH endonuclease OS=Pseudanabaena biceps PCC 7429 GN=Pse7429DRAFT_1180 PE=4 SV=1: HNH [Gemmataceae bacterium]VTU01121.1 hnh endonuclease : HNH endonuclease OS=Pseudanabaena biceps PCC 7429 GN=Pse7429DRAFT_1180 PE=4 SV=1: HNH [Gemmataceae bacterium]
MTSWAETVRQVAARAGYRCEYCRMHQSLQGATFHIEHISPQSAGGSDDPGNLALACPGCNLAKSSRVASPDSETGLAVPLFNPRTQRWGDHFAWNADRRVVGLTAIGRATVDAIDLNRPRRVMIREAEEWFNLFPPDDPT